MKKTDTTDAVMREALEHFQESDDGTSDARNAARDDIKFARLDDQWPEEIKNSRREEGRPCLTINRLPSFIRQVVNDARLSSPSITVRPTDSDGSVETAEVINGLIRSIERRSNADEAYDTAIDHSATCGYGFITIGIDFIHQDSFDLEARIHRVPDPLAVYWDPTSTAFDASDWGYAFISDSVSQDEFKTFYPDKDPISFEGTDAGSWMDDSRVCIADYWLRESTKRKLLQLSTGMTLREDELTDEVKFGLDMQGIEIVREREVDAFNVIRRKISGAEVLEEEVWPGSSIPIAPVWGEEVMLDGKRHFRSLIRSAKDSQNMFNFWRTASTELVALAPRAPWIMQEGAIPKGMESAWQTANTRSHPYLMHTQGTPMPQRQPFAGVPAGALQEAMNSADDMKAIIGIYDSSLGARSNETSGIAINARQRESDVSTFNYIDNLNRAIRYLGQCLTDIIPAVYKDRQSVRILGEDRAESVALLMGSNQGQILSPDGERMYDLSVGVYDVDVKSGPSFSSQREETRQTLTEIMRAIPDSAVYIGDVLMEHMDFVGADKIANRLKMLLPPEMRQSEEEGDDGMPPEARQMIAQMEQQGQQQMQQGQQQMQAMQQEAQQAIAGLQAQLQQATEAAQKANQGAMQAKMAMQGDQTDAALKAKEIELKEATLLNAAAQAEKDRAQKAFEAERNRELELAKMMIAAQDQGEPDATVIARAAAMLARE